MTSEYSEETIITEESDEEITIFEKINNNEHNIVIFDWDNTLFFTQYLDMLKLDYKALFSDQKPLEDEGAYLIEEMRNLEEVK